jgi:hypothetical protein
LQPSAAVIALGKNRENELVVESLPGSIFYFESIRMGLIAIAKSFGWEMSFSRFSGDIVQEGGFTAKHSDESH